MRIIFQICVPEQVITSATTHRPLPLQHTAPRPGLTKPPTKMEWDCCLSTHINALLGQNQTLSSSLTHGGINCCPHMAGSAIPPIQKLIHVKERQWYHHSHILHLSCTLPFHTPATAKRIRTMKHPRPQSCICAQPTPTSPHRHVPGSSCLQICKSLIGASNFSSSTRPLDWSGNSVP